MSFSKTYAEAKATHKSLSRKSPLRRTGIKSQPVSLSEGEKTADELKAVKRKPFKRGVRIDAADKFFSLYIRYRDNWQCQRCLTKYQPVTNALHNSHFWGRARESTRFDPVNCVAHCHGCHSFFTANPEEHRAWKLKQIGQREYDLLMIRAHTTHKKDRKLAALIYKELYQKEQARYESEVLKYESP